MPNHRRNYVISSSGPIHHAYISKQGRSGISHFMPPSLQKEERRKRKQRKMEKEGVTNGGVILCDGDGGSGGACMVLPDPTHRETKSQDNRLWNMSMTTYIYA